MMKILRIIRSIPFEFAYLNRKLDRIMLDISKLSADVAAQGTVIASAVKALTGLSAALGDVRQQLAVALAQNDPAAVAAAQKALDDLDAQLTQNTAELATAVPANTETPPVA
jgi:hypothetical protein